MSNQQTDAANLAERLHHPAAGISAARHHSQSRGPERSGRSAPGSITLSALIPIIVLSIGCQSTTGISHVTLDPAAPDSEIELAQYEVPEPPAPINPLPLPPPSSPASSSITPLPQTIAMPPSGHFYAGPTFAAAEIATSNQQTATQKLLELQLEAMQLRESNRQLERELADTRSELELSRQALARSEEEINLARRQIVETSDDLQYWRHELRSIYEKVKDSERRRDASLDDVHQLLDRVLRQFGHDAGSVESEPPQPAPPPVPRLEPSEPPPVRVREVSRGAIRRSAIDPLTTREFERRNRGE